MLKIYLLSLILSLAIYCEKVYGNTPFAKYKIDSKICNVVEHNKSRIFVPAYSFTTVDNKIYSGNAYLCYREFVDQLDIVLNEIPMNYNTNNGDIHQLESTGMFELYAIAENGDTLNMDKQKQITVQIASNWNTKGNEGFYFDKIQNKWLKNSLFGEMNKGNVVLPRNENELWEDDVWNMINTEEPMMNSINNFDVVNMVEENFKTLNINNFGLYNCDRLIEENTIPIYASFKLESTKSNINTTIYLVYKNLNTVYSFYPNKEIKLLILPDQEFVIFAFSNNGAIAKVKDEFLKDFDVTNNKNKKILFPMEKVENLAKDKTLLANALGL
jgi:hypothetical protein